MFCMHFKIIIYKDKTEENRLVKKILISLLKKEAVSSSHTSLLLVDHHNW